MTINIGIVEDENLCQQQLIRLIKDWEQNTGITTNLKTYFSSEDYFQILLPFAMPIFLIFRSIHILEWILHKI